MKVVVNGEPLELPDAASVEHAIAATGVVHRGRGVAVAVDGEVVTRGEWESTLLAEGQRVEVLRAVQGG